MLRANRTNPLLVALSLLALVAAAGCKATAEDIEQWKTTVKGPGKIVAVLLSENYDIELRTKAALALVEMSPRTQPERLDPLAELQRSIQRLDDATRGEIIQAMVPGLEALLAAEETAAEDESGPPPAQVRAKDAAYLLIAHAEGQARDRLVSAVIGWYVQDFNGRNLAGNYSAQQIVESLGSPAARMLVEAMKPEMPQPALVKLAELIGQLGDPETKTRAGQRLVEIERHMETNEFLEWLRGEIRASMVSQLGAQAADLGVRYAVPEGKLTVAQVPDQSPGKAAGLEVGDVIVAVGDAEVTDPMAAIESLRGPVDSQVSIRLQRGGNTRTLTATRGLDNDRIEETATRNRELFIQDGALAAMKHLNEVPEVAERLLVLAEQSSTGDDDPITLRRRRALQALEGGAKDQHLERLLAIALSASVTSSVRDYAFDRVGDIRNAQAIPRMWPLLEVASYDNEGQRLRWRAGEMILLIGGPPIVDEFLRRLPAEEGVKYEPEELEGYAQRMSQMSPPPTERMRRELREERWWNRVIALRYFERKGQQNDLAAMQRLVRDRAPVAGDAWSRLELSTVGDVAEAAIASFRERLSGEAGEDEGGSGGQEEPTSDVGAEE